MTHKWNFPKITSDLDRMTFGKWRGYTIRYILDHDPGYITWLANKEICFVSDDILFSAKKITPPREDRELNSWEYENNNDSWGDRD